MRLDAVGLATAVVLLGSSTGASDLPSVQMPLSRPGYRIYVENKHLESALSAALPQASRRLATSACRAILHDFHDARGRTLRSNLQTLGCEAHEYLRLVVFVNGEHVRRCQKRGVLAVTMPGSRVVHVCRSFAWQHQQRPAWAELILIHEALHSLGLEERPVDQRAPTTDAITRQIQRRCGNAALERRQRPVAAVR
jgi:hypothetical protein